VPSLDIVKLYDRIVIFRNSHLTRINDDVNVGWVGKVGDWRTGLGAWDER